MYLLASLALTALLAGEPTPPAGSATTPSATLTNTESVAEFNRLQADDDAAQAEVDKWVRQNNLLRAAGAGLSDADMERRITERFEPIKKAYEEFLRRHPADAKAHLLFGNLLNDRQDEHGAQVQWEQALALDPANPAVYNNLAGRYSESGPVNKAFEFFAKALELKPDEPAFYHNFADSLYVLRKRAVVYYGITEQQVLAKILTLYSNALRLDPMNFAFARDLAQTYYSLKPIPTDEALAAWTNAAALAREPADREDVHVHLARVKMLAGRLAEARAQLDAVTNAACLPAKAALLHSLEERERQAQIQPANARGSGK